jgi:hypothetical protein
MKGFQNTGLLPKKLRKTSYQSKFIRDILTSVSNLRLLEFDHITHFGFTTDR